LPGPVLADEDIFTADDSVMSQGKNNRCDVLLLGTVVTMDRDHTIIEDGAVAVCGATIAAVGPARELRQLPGGGDPYLPKALIMPGLVNAHPRRHVTCGAGR
jgi:predicted amidohydrolase YtcJ